MNATPNNKAQASLKAAGQAAIELAVFGAILVFILGTIVRTAMSNGYTQNENFKAMRMAMLTSWQYSELSQGNQATANTSHNTTSILFLEDRLSPDATSKYGDLDRNPYMSMGSGTFSYELEYPWQPGQDNPVNLIPIEDVWINGVHFPFSTAAYVVNRTIEPPSSCSNAAGSCAQNQCLRNQREWVGGTVSPSMFQNVITFATLDSTTSAALAASGQAIFNELANEGYIAVASTANPLTASSGTVVSTSIQAPFVAWLSTTYAGAGQAEANKVQTILASNSTHYKLFFTQAVNGAKSAASSSSSGANVPNFSITPPASCSGVNNALCGTAELPTTTSCPQGQADASTGLCINTDGYMQYDLQRTGDYAAVDTAFPPNGTLRSSMVWQWQATPGTSASSIGLDVSSNEFPQYDIDGRLKEVTIYGISQNSDGSPSVTYEDYQGGDLDNTWDSNSCGPKAGLLNNAEVFTSTQEGTYLMMQEGKLFNPETNQFVRSANKRNTIDVIQREIQLSNNTGRFCDASGNLLSTVGNDGVTPNPVEVCVAANSGDSCFSSANIARICYDENDNIIFVRSRLEDRRGHLWMTNTSGQMNIH